MDAKNRLIELLSDVDMVKLGFDGVHYVEIDYDRAVEYLLTNGVVPLVLSEWDYGDEPPEPDENGNVQAVCKHCYAGDVHAERNINKVPYCWKCGAKMKTVEDTHENR